MSKIKNVLTIAALATALFAIQSCNNGNNQHKGEHHSGMHQEQQEDMHHTYACPMHPEIIGVKGDNCSKCGMELEEVKNK